VVLRRPIEGAAAFFAKENDYRNALSKYAMVASMSRKGDCWDNAVAESFFATLRAELVDDERYTTRRTAEHSIGQYIETFYNVERLHSHLDYVSPIEFELKMRMNRFAA
jgi:transposase InsO family protein